MSTEQQRTLRFLAGSWRGEEVVESSPWDPESDVMSGRFDAHVEVDDGILVADYSEERGGRVCYRAHGILGCDAEGYFLYWFDPLRQGCCPAPARGHREGDRLVFACQTRREWARFSFELEGTDRFTFRREVSPNGVPGSPIIETRFDRVHLERAAVSTTAPRGEGCPFRGVCPAGQVMALSERT